MTMFQSRYLPKPRNYGFVSEHYTHPIRSIRPRPIELRDISWLENLTRGAAPNIAMPDIVKVHWGAGDPAIVGEMYRVLLDKPTNLVGVSKELVRKYFAEWGYPEDPTAMTADEFASKQAEYALEPNPVAILSQANTPDYGGF